MIRSRRSSWSTWRIESAIDREKIRFPLRTLWTCGWEMPAIRARLALRQFTAADPLPEMLDEAPLQFLEVHPVDLFLGSYRGVIELT